MKKIRKYSCAKILFFFVEFFCGWFIPFLAVMSSFFPFLFHIRMLENRQKTFNHYKLIIYLFFNFWNFKKNHFWKVWILKSFRSFSSSLICSGFIGIWGNLAGPKSIPVNSFIATFCCTNPGLPERANNGMK